MRALYASAVALALAWPAAPAMAQGEQSWQITARSIQDTTVYDANGERVGQLADLLTGRDGEIAAVLIDMDSGFGRDEGLVAAPYGSLIFMDPDDSDRGALARPRSVYLDGLTKADLARFSLDQ